MMTNKRCRMVIVSLPLLANFLLGKIKQCKSSLPDDIKVEGVGQRIEDHGDGDACFMIVSSESFSEHDPNYDPPVIEVTMTELKPENTNAVS